MKTDHYWLRQKLLAYARQHGIKDTARCFGCSRNTVRKWLRRYRAGTPSSLLAHSRRPHHCPRQTPPSIEGLVVRLRRQTGFGAERLHVEFRLPCGVNAIRRILRVHGLVRARKKKHTTKRSLRSVKAQWRLFQQLLADTKYLQDIPHYWPQMRRLGLPRFQYTVREPVGGLCFSGYADERAKSYAVLLGEQVSAHPSASLRTGLGVAWRGSVPSRMADRQRLGVSGRRWPARSAQHRAGVGQRTSLHSAQGAHMAERCRDGASAGGGRVL
jgi:transposase